MKALFRPSLFPGSEIAFASLLLPVFLSAAPSLEVSTDREDALYKENEEVVFTIRAKDGDRNINQGEIAWTLSMDGFGKLGEGKIQPGARVIGSKRSRRCSGKCCILA